MQLYRSQFSMLVVLLGSALATASASSPAPNVGSANVSKETQGVSTAAEKQTGSESLSDLINEGITAAKAGHYAVAIADYKKALAIDPHCTPALINLGLAYFKSGNFQDATPPLESALRDGTDSDQIHTLLAMSFYYIHRYREAGLQFEILFRRKPSNQMIQYLLAESYMRSHQAEELPELVQRLHAISPDSPVVHMLAGEQYDRLGRTEDAIREFQRAAVAAPNMPLIHFSLGYLYWETHRLSDAAREFRIEAEIKNGERAQALGFLGDIALHSGNEAKAERLFHESLQIDSGVRIVQYGLGVICAEKKQSAEAVRHLKTAIELDPGQIDAYYRLAMVYRQLGQIDREHALLTKVAELNSAKRQSIGEAISQGP